MEKYGFRGISSTDVPLSPMDPSLIPPEILETNWGKFYAPLNAMYYHGLKDIYQVGSPVEIPGVFDNYSMAHHYWGQYSEWPMWTNPVATAQLMNVFESMRENYWPRMFAEGGIVKSATLGIVGEAGPEAIIPLSKISEVAEDLNITSGGGGGGGTAELVSELNEVKEALLALAEAIGDQPIETNVQIDGKTLVQQITKAARVMGKGNTFILPKNTVR